MATPCISPPKVNLPIHNNLLSSLNTSVSESRKKYCSARHVDVDNVIRCRFAYATWCPVCEDQDRKESTRTKSEGMEVEKREDYYVKAVNYRLETGSSRDQSFCRRNMKYPAQSECASALDVNKRLTDAHGLSSEHQDNNVGKHLKHVRRRCENHIEPNCMGNSDWNCKQWTYPYKENDLMPLHDSYYYEVEMLRSKLNRLRDHAVDGKIVENCGESGHEINCVSEFGFKRPRDSSPLGSRPHSSGKLLPAVPTAQSSYKAPLQTRDVLSSSNSATSLLSESGPCYSGFDEEEFEVDDGRLEEEVICFDDIRKDVDNCSNSSSLVVNTASTESLGDSEALVPTGKLHPGLRSSLFSHVPPYIRFSTHDTKGDALPSAIQKQLKWKLSTITPVVVRKTVANSNFKLVRRSNDWCGTWGKHMKSTCFKTLREYQKLNHFPGTFQIGRKDRLWKNLFRLMSKFGKKEFGFIPRTYVLPQDNKLLRSAWEKNCGKEKWIVKPPASARGTGIRVVHKWTQIPKKCPLVVQKYIADPYLINGSKFDLRLYVLVTSMNPLRIYMYDNGLVRFASVKYSKEMTSLADRYMHLTNYSINKLSSQYTQNEDASACRGHKWSLQALWVYLEKEKGVDVTSLQQHLVDLVIKTIISGESSISQLTQANLASRYCSYELFGVDVLLDYNLKPWLLEVNISPSLHSTSPLDLAVKGPMVRDLMNMAGYQIPNRLSPQAQSELADNLGVDSQLCFDRRLHTTALSSDEKQKHVTFQELGDRDEYLTEILQDLTSDDVRHLISYEDELTQIGNFQKVFPTTETHDYHQFFEAPRYYNMLFDAWELKQSKDRTVGIDLLESLCQKQFHLDTTQIPPKRTKVCSSPNSSELASQENGLPQKEDTDVTTASTPSITSNKVKEKWKMTLAYDTICRAARSRSGKPGLVTKPYPRSAYVARRPVLHHSAHSN